MGTTISALVKGYLDTGEEKYFEELLERFSPLIKAYARKLYYLEYDDMKCYTNVVTVVANKI